MIIGLIGIKGCGKTTAAERLVNVYGFERVAMASVLKDMLRTFGLNEDQISDPDVKEQPSELLCGKSPRIAMQTLGTEWGRNCIGENVWVNAWQKKAEAFKHVVADDVRFPNEADHIRSVGGVLIRIVRDGWTSPDAHESERYAASEDLMPADITFFPSSVEQLYMDLEEVMMSHGISPKTTVSLNIND